MSVQNSDHLAAVRRIVMPHLRQSAGVDDDTPLVTGGRIDSMAMVELVVEIEDQLGVPIPAALVQAADFDSIRLIVQTVERFDRARCASRRR